MSTSSDTTGRGRVELSVDLAAPPHAVWAAFVDPEQNDRWLLTFRMISDWRVGGPFAIRGQLNRKPYAETGTVLAFAPNELLSYDHWSRLWRIPDRPENRAILTFRFVAREGGTRLTLTHDLPVVEALVEHSQFFWTGALDRLTELLS